MNTSFGEHWCYGKFTGLGVQQHNFYTNTRLEVNSFRQEISNFEQHFSAFSVHYHSSNEPQPYETKYYGIKLVR